MTGFKWFDPIISFSQNPFVWQDYIHAIRDTMRDNLFMGYESYCDKVFLVPALGDVIEELELNNLPDVNCPRCLSALHRADRNDMSHCGDPDGRTEVPKADENEP